jgi:hypothetical protein
LFERKSISTHFDLTHFDQRTLIQNQRAEKKKERPVICLPFDLQPPSVRIFLPQDYSSGFFLWDSSFWFRQQIFPYPVLFEVFE